MTDRALPPSEPDPDGRLASAGSAAVPGSASKGQAAAEELPRMGLLDHLDELRKRILRSVIVVIVGFLGCWSFAPWFVEILSRPITPLLPADRKLAFFAPTEAFMLYIKVSLLVSIFLMAPFLLYQLWAFISPGLYRKEKRFAIPFIFFGSVFFLAGGVFAYYVALPFALEFLVDLGSEQFEPLISATTYFHFMMAVVLGLGVMFELPILIFLLSWIGIVTPRFLMRHFRWAVLLIFIVSAIITPTPDIFNLCLFALPTLALYLLGVGVSAVVLGNRKRLATQKAADVEGSEGET